MRMAQKNYKQNESKLQHEKIVDLETSLDINNGVLTTLMAQGGISEVMKQVNDENTYLKKRLKNVQKDIEITNTKVLLLEQINADFKMKEHMISRTFEEQIAELKEILEKKEAHMQTKEKKWLEIEEIMEEYAADDEELREKFREIRISIRPD